MPYLPTIIANDFLQKASQEGRALTPLQVLKLVYLAHGWCLGVHRQPLIDEPVEAWRAGPVIRSLYNAIKQYGSNAITERLPVRWFSWGRALKIDATAAAILASVWVTYRRYGGVELAEITCAEGSPWWTTWKGLNENAMDAERWVIDNALIQAFYAQKIKAHNAGEGEHAALT
ncbi:Panacea domain-containing protein [Xylella fastidiosa]|uniref:Panacea domain-containing protein n=1 Tax=Xylella fastidiosa TaxID=2371 RepID=UPI001EEC5F38|nr:Panacea domain-containing protein [Xylella fastidiosa]WLE26409.1 SocA family protein [Xylella fastidiosa subsp. multiplex]